MVYSGAYDVAATEEPIGLLRWAYSTTVHNSVERRADAFFVPEEFTDAMVEAGAGSYKSMCEVCHGSLGAARPDLVNGMRPQPPHMTEAAAE